MEKAEAKIENITQYMTAYKISRAARNQFKEAIVKCGSLA